MRTLDWNAATTPTIAEPGVYDLPADVYHADPVEGGSLSSSGARKLLPPSCPALYHHERQHGRPPKRDFDFGHAAHKLVLGVGAQIVLIDADNFKTKAAQQQRDEAYAAGLTPLLAHEYAIVEAMAERLRAHPAAAALFAPDSGKPEQALFWQDRETGIWCRAMLDWLRNPTPGRMIVPDYKTAVSAAPEAFEKAMDNYGYARQSAWYLDAVKALGLADNPAFVFVVQEKTAPFLVSVYEPTDLTLEIGRHYNRQARQVFAQCQQTGNWPGYSDDVELISLPAWAQTKYFAETGL